MTVAFRDGETPAHVGVLTGSATANTTDRNYIVTIAPEDLYVDEVTVRYGAGSAPTVTSATLNAVAAGSDPIATAGTAVTGSVAIDGAGGSSHTVVSAYGVEGANKVTKGQTLVLRLNSTPTTGASMPFDVAIRYHTHEV